MFNADTDNHRILRWKPNATQVGIIAGREGKGDRPDQLNQLASLLIDRFDNY